MRGLLFKIVIVITLLLFDSLYLTNTGQAKKSIEMMPWEEANQVLPKYTKFTVKDVETGKQFRVQRRAGSQHADVQPLTSKDTAIMKKIYNGKWSWKRRAIIVIKDQEKIAASMHGMPHGAGALKNNFPGHFCIHFFGSTTHRTNHMDLSHKLMIYKAAGKLKEYLAGADPYEVVNAYVVGLKEQDRNIATLITLQPVQWKDVFREIENIRITRMTVLPVEDLQQELQVSVPVEIDMYGTNIGSKRFRSNIQLIRFSQLDQWRVDSSSFLAENGIK